VKNARYAFLNILLFGVKFGITQTFFVVFICWLLRKIFVFLREPGECDTIVPKSMAEKDLLELNMEPLF